MLMSTMPMSSMSMFSVIMSMVIMLAMTMVMIVFHVSHVCAIEFVSIFIANVFRQFPKSTSSFGFVASIK
jgi:hypothetical protein